jgi:hypothetical protein
MDIKWINTERLAHLAAGCADVIQRRLDEIPQLEAELEGLNGNTCTGREWWRDRNHESKTPKLYILHSVDQACPLHGKPEPGDRLRVYVGSDPANIAEARAAMDREDLRKRLETRLDNIVHGLSRSDHYLHSFYSVLGYIINDDDGAVTSR